LRLCGAVGTSPTYAIGVVVEFGPTGFPVIRVENSPAHGVARLSKPSFVETGSEFVGRCAARQTHPDCVVRAVDNHVLNLVRVAPADQRRRRGTLHSRVFDRSSQLSEAGRERRVRW
jgi:hypothetical protein